MTAARLHSHGHAGTPRSTTWAALAFSLVALSAGACVIGVDAGSIGDDCDDTGDCDDRALACVPLDAEDPNGERACMPPPEDWSCDADLLGDGACDCGCDLQDVDCPDTLATSCASDGNQCPGEEQPVANDNTTCQ